MNSEDRAALDAQIVSTRTHLADDSLTDEQRVQRLMAQFGISEFAAWQLVELVGGTWKSDEIVLSGDGSGEA